jgi:NAD(P)-dependent dehydrogenase (short-subunit alcohol dehydrogenase family)
MAVKIEGCTALVTGANRGIGQGFVRELLQRGARRVHVAARSLSDAEDVVAEAPDRLVAVRLDVTNPEQVAAAARDCPDVDLLISNAGAFEMQTLLTAPDTSAMRKEIEVNYLGPVALIRAFAPVLKRNGGGAIGWVLSAGGIVAVPDMGGYSPSKFAGRAAATCLRAELAPQGTTLTALIVGSVDTRMAAHVKRAKSQPQDVAASSLPAIEAGVEEHDTDPHALEVRAMLHRDPAGLAASMARRVQRQPQPAQ